MKSSGTTRAARGAAITDPVNARRTRAAGAWETFLEQIRSGDEACLSRAKKVYTLLNEVDEHLHPGKSEDAGESNAAARYRLLLEKRLLGKLTEKETREYDAARRSLLATSRASSKRHSEIKSAMIELGQDKPKIAQIINRYRD